MMTMEEASIDPNSTSNVAYVIEPNKEDIFCDILPRRLLEGRVYIPHPINDFVKEIDLYVIDLPPQQLLDYYGGGGGGGDDNNFYFLTILKRKTEKKYNRVVGSCGTWNNRRKDPCSLEIDGLKMIVGEKRLFNFAYSRNKDFEQDEEAGIKWIMREYAMKEGYINYLLKKYNLDVNNGGLIELYKNVVFCHIYKKVDKKKQQDFDTIVEQNRFCVIEDQENSQQQHNSGELTTTIDNGHNNYGELATTTMDSGPLPCSWIPVPYDVPRQFSNIYDARAQPYPVADPGFL